MGGMSGFPRTITTSITNLFRDLVSLLWQGFEEIAMDAALNRQLVATLEFILKTTNSLQTGEHWLRYNKAYGNLRISSEASVKLAEVADKLLDKWKDKFSAAYIFSSLTELLGKARRDGPDQIDPLLTALEQKYLTHTTRHLGLIPIVGMDILIGSLEIGNVSFGNAILPVSTS